MAYTLEHLTGLARALLDAEADSEAAAHVASAAAERVRVLREDTLPNIMLEIGIDKITLTTGQVLSLKQDVYASITKENRDEAFGWLTEQGLDSVIKTEVVTAWGKGELKKAIKFFKSLQKRKGIVVLFNQEVHPQTLKALLREQIAIGANIPMETFGARAVFVAKVK